MVKKMSSKIFMLFSIIFLLSCKENVPIYISPDTMKFFPLKVGNYWVYESYSIDDKYNRISGTESIDSLVVTAKISLLGSSCFVILRYNDGIFKDTLFLYIDKNQLFRLHNGETDSIPGLVSKFFKIGDLDLKEWNIYADIQSDSNFVFDSKKITATRHYAINGSVLDPVKVYFNNDSITLLPLVYKDDRMFSFDFYFNEDSNKSNIEIITQKTERFWLKSDVGIMIWQFDPFVILTRSDSVNNYNPGKYSRFPGWKKDLLRYKI